MPSAVHRLPPPRCHLCGRHWLAVEVVLPLVVPPRVGRTVVVAAVLALASALAALGVETHETCGVTSVRALGLLLALDPERNRGEEADGSPARAEVSMAQVADHAETLGIHLHGVAASLDTLVEEGRVPCIIHLKAPAHFLTVARASSEWVQLLDSGRVIVVPREEIEKRYSGHALILDQSQFPDGGARLEVPDFHHTFGIAGVGQEVEHAFTIRNAGDEDLVVVPQSGTCCGAPKVTIPTDTLPPGETTQVTVSFTITYSGSVMKSAKLLTTDPTQPVVFLTVHGKVPHDLRVYPDRIYLGGDKGALPIRTVTISGPAEMDLTEVTTERGLFDLTLSEPRVSEDEKKTWTLELAFKPESFVGEIADQLSINTTHAERPLVTIPITGRIRGDLRVTPPSVFFGFVKPAAQAQQTVTIQSRSFALFTVNSATSDAPKITAGTPEEKLGVWSISVSVDTSREGVVEGAVTVVTDVPGEETLTIPVYAHVIAEQ